MFKALSVFLIFGLMSISACSKSSKLEASDPKHVLADYISKSFSVKSLEDRSQLVAYLTGDVKARLANWSEDQFRAAFVNSRREFLKLSFRETKVISPVEVEITYELSYVEGNRNSDRGGSAGESKVTNKKLCQMLLVDGKWLIADVRNIKELVEFKNELSFP